MEWESTGLWDPVWFNRGYKNKPLQSRDRHICHFIWRNKTDSMHVVKGDKRAIYAHVKLVNPGVGSNLAPPRGSQVLHGLILEKL